MRFSLVQAGHNDRGAPPTARAIPVSVEPRLGTFVAKIPRFRGRARGRVAVRSCPRTSADSAVVPLWHNRGRFGVDAARGVKSTIRGDVSTGMGQGKFRLVTRSDFDGLVCAVVLKELDLVDD